MGQYNDGKTRQSRTRSKRHGKGSLPLGMKIQMQAIAKKAAQSVPEKKHFDVDLGPIGVGSTTRGSPIVTALSNISQGDSENERVGNHVTPVYLGGRYTVTGVAGAGSAVARVRVLIVQYKANTGDSGEPVMSILIQNNVRPFTYINTNKSNQFRVVYDAKHYIVNDKSSEAYSVYGEYNVDLRKYDHIDFNDATTGGSNKYYLLAISDYTNVDLAVPTITMDTRMRYIDA